MINKLLVVSFLLTNLFSQINQDARMLGLSGAYTNLASGFRVEGINPANLAIYNTLSWNIFNISFGLSNNFFSENNYNTLSGAHFDDITDPNYYPKDLLINKFGGIGVRLNQTINLPLPGLNMSKDRYALTSKIVSNLDIGLSDGVVQLLFLGNPYQKEIDLNIEEVFYLTHELGFSYGYAFQGFSAGFTIKYLAGLLYMGMETINNPVVTTDINGMQGVGQYMLRKDLGGRGVGLDVGIISDEFSEGFRFGCSIINLFGTINWAKNNLFRDLIKNSLNTDDLYYRTNEFLYYNLVIDSIAVSSFIQELEEPFIYYESYKVFAYKSVVDLDIDAEDSLIVELSDGTYLVPSGGKYSSWEKYSSKEVDTSYTISDNYSKYSQKGTNALKTRQPIYLRLGLTKKWENQGIIAMDFVTGFMNRLGSSSSWKFSIGTEITRFTDKFLRMGFSFGGYTDKSISFGYGVKMKRIVFDIGLSMNGGFSLSSLQGADVAMGFIWQLQ